MTCWVVTPVKAPDDCKTRLRPALTDEARRALVGRMLRHVVDVARRASGVDEVLLLGPSDHGLPASIRRLEDPGGGLNAALAAAMDIAVEAGVDRLVIVAADLPQIAAADLAGLVDAPTGTIVVAPDCAGAGTNALSLPLPAAAAFRFRYGEGSFAAHEAQAALLGLQVRILRSPGLGLDIDAPEDLAALAAG